jgi:hypothetical protein
MEQLLPALVAKASYPASFGAALGGSVNVVGVDNAETSGHGRCRSRRDLLEIVTNPKFRGPSSFKVAALGNTIAYPIQMPLYPGDPRLLLVSMTGLSVSFLLRQ